MSDTGCIHYLLFDEENEQLLCAYNTRDDKWLIDSYSQKASGTEWVKQSTYEQPDLMKYSVYNVVIHQKEVYAHLQRKSDDRRSIHQLDKRNMFSLGQQLDTSNIPAYENWTLITNQSYLVVLCWKTFFLTVIRSVHLFKNKQQVKQLQMNEENWGLTVPRPVVTNSTRFILRQTDTLSLVIIDFDKWDSKSVEAKRVIRLQHGCYSYCWLEESDSSGYLVAADFTINDTKLYIYKVNLDSVQEEEEMMAMYQVDLGLTYLRIYPTNGKVVLVEGKTKAKDGEKSQRAFITLNL